jgi:hypothetical protein
MKCLARSEVNHVDRFDFERFRITLLKLLQAGGLTARSCDHLPISSTVFFSKGQTEASGCAYHQDRLLHSHLKLSYLPVWRRRSDVIEYGFRVRAELSSSWLANDLSKTTGLAQAKFPTPCQSSGDAIPVMEALHPVGEWQWCLGDFIEARELFRGQGAILRIEVGRELPGRPGSDDYRCDRRTREYPCPSAASPGSRRGAACAFRLAKPPQASRRPAARRTFQKATPVQSNCHFPVLSE